MNDGLVKSFDNLMLQQEKMDNKAYIFIGFLTLVFGYINKGWEDISIITWTLIIIALPLVISLTPVANKIVINIMTSIIGRKKQKELNIFYYIDLYQLSKEDFIELFNKEYERDNLSRYDEKLIEEILINAKILKVKVLWHNIAQLFALVSGVIFILYLIKY